MGRHALSFAVVVAMYNEAVSAEGCVRSISGTLQDLPGRSCLIVVNDGSTDCTAEILERLRTEDPDLTIITHSQNEGYGEALYTGVSEAARRKFNYVLFMDSDLTNDPAYLPRFVEKMRDGFDVIKATRYSGGGSVDGVPFWKRLISVVGNRLAKFLFRISINDCTNGFRAIRTDLLVKIHPRETGFAVIMEELFYLKHMTNSFAEIPYTLKTHNTKLRMSSFKYTAKVFWDYLKYPLRWFLGLRLPSGTFSSRAGDRDV